MMDRKEIEHVFQWSDEYIKKNPEILNKSTNDIFEELDDGTKEMHLKWTRCLHYFLNTIIPAANLLH